MRVISICPSNTELMEYLDLTSFLIALDDDSDWPKHIQHLPRLGRDLSIDMDKLVAMEPDLVLASLSVPGMEKNVEQLQKRQIPHLVLNPQSLHDIYLDLLKVGEACGIQDEAEERAKKYINLVEELRTIGRSQTQQPTIYWEWWPKPVFTPGRINWLTEVSQLAGGINAYEDVELASVQTDWNDVKRRNPDVIAMAWVGVQQQKMKASALKKRPGWQEMKAIQNHTIHLLEEELYCRPSPRLLEGVVKLGKLLHPESYEKY
ncbi:cobalamin-binding protein [Bacillus sp. 2205SS5-2]|uniref:cobalamin-binding protein n=1 Tax=Bacillus sp. 2205SS5-2 TaxID=3109031 RepID=UPI003004D9A3